MFALAGVAETMIIYDFPIFGVVNGAQTARINAVLQQPPERDMPCPVTLSFIDSQGNTRAIPRNSGDPNIRIGARVALRVRVAYGNPDQFPGCATRVLTSVEVVNKTTRATQYTLANPVKTEIPARQ